jgi:periplasmic copper chaperone A
MRRRTSMPLTAALTLAVLLGPLARTGAAHVHVEPEDDPDPGAEVELRFVFDHGCYGHPTTELSVLLPDGIDPAEVTPVEEDGWRAVVDDATVTWTGGDPIPDHTLHEFRMAAVLPPTPGATLHFPTIQRCDDEEVAWIQVPDDGEDPADLERPAPALQLTDRPPPEPEEPEVEPEPAPEDPTPSPTPTALELELAGADDDRTLLGPAALVAALLLVAATATWAARRART